MSPRNRGRRTIGAWIEKTPTGRLRVCFRWPPRKGPLYRITTEFRDNAEDRRRLEGARDLIGAEIRNGIFDPARRFPSLFTPKIVIEPAAKPYVTLAADMRAWIVEKEKRKIRRSRVRDYRSHLNNYFEVAPIGTLDPAAIGKTALDDFVTWLVSAAGEDGKGVSEKTAQNVIRGTLRAYRRDRSYSLTVLDALRWERYAPQREQEPFEESERNRILGWFRSKRPFEEHVSLRLRFRGVSPSEARGFNVGDFNRTTGTILVRRSRHLGAEGATKTVARERLVLLDDDLARDIATLCGLRDPGEPLLSVAEDTLRDNFMKAQKALGIRHRSLYQTKHTYATLELLGGESAVTVARNLGISLATLEKHYAAALKQGRLIAMEKARKAAGNPTETPRRRIGAANYLINKASPTGFEPVLPA